jgi:hypothetical protein
MVEMALVFPLFILLFFGILILGIGIFYQQQVTNAAREAARFASTHSATAAKPTVSKLDPVVPPLSYVRWDRPEDGWPDMTAAARQRIFGVKATDVQVAACWSGYEGKDGAGQPDPTKYDYPPPASPPGYELVPGASPPQYWNPEVGWAQCTIDGADPTADASAIGCSAGLADTTVDTASSISEGQGRIVANTVTAYACYIWRPPLAGFLLIPQNVTLRAVITEPIQRQQ